MAIAITNLAAAGDTADRGTGDPYQTASVTLEPGRLYILAVFSSLTDTPETPAISSTGATWNLRESVDYFNIASPDIRLCVFLGTVASQQTGQVAIEYTSTMTGCRWSLEEVTGHDTSTPIVQDAENRADTGTSFAITLASFADAVNNAMYAVAGKSSTEATNKEAGHTLLSDGSTTAVLTLHMTVVWQTGEDTAPTFTTASNRFWGGIALEIAIEEEDEPAAGAAGGLISPLSITPLQITR